MNSININLSSNNTSFIGTIPLIEMDDFTRLNINVDNISERVLPIYIDIDWGTGDREHHDNDAYNIKNTINLLNFNPILNNTYSYNYYPSETSLYKLLSAQVAIRYGNGDITWFLIPIKIRTYGYYESIGDLTLINTNILPSDDNSSEHQLKTLRDGYIIELRND